MAPTNSGISGGSRGLTSYQKITCAFSSRCPNLPDETGMSIQNAVHRPRPTTLTRGRRGTTKKPRHGIGAAFGLSASLLPKRKRKRLPIPRHVEALTSFALLHQPQVAIAVIRQLAAVGGHAPDADAAGGDRPAVVVHVGVGAVGDLEDDDLLAARI